MADNNGKYKTDEELQRKYRQVRHNGRPRDEHIVIAEQMWGGPLPEGYVVHHINGDSLDNRPANLMLLPNEAAHKKIHAMMRALDACGNPNYRPCKYCKKYDDPKRMTYNSTSHRHKECHNKYMREHYANRKLSSI